MPEKHGQGRRSAQSRLYKAWAGMRRRCNNPNDASYPFYGGRGIKVCARWTSFIAFEADVGPHPGDGWTLDRINSNGDYKPSNCRWATRVTQGRNNRKAALTEAVAAQIRKLYGPWKWKGKPTNGITQAELAKKFGVTQTAISKVLSGSTWR